MKTENIVRKLVKMGYEVTDVKVSYYGEFPSIVIDGCDVVLVRICRKNNTTWTETTFKFREIVTAIEKAKKILSYYRTIQSITISEINAL